MARTTFDSYGVVIATGQARMLGLIAGLENPGAVLDNAIGVDESMRAGWPRD